MYLFEIYLWDMPRLAHIRVELLPYHPIVSHKYSIHSPYKYICSRYIIYTYTYPTDMKNIINVIYHLMYHHKTVSYIRYISLSYHHGRPKHHRQKSPNQGHPTVETQSRTPGRADLGCPTVFFSEEDMGNSTRKYGDQEWNMGYICVCVCVPLIIGGWPTKRPMMRAANVPATFHLRTWPTWLSHKPPMQTWHANMITWHYMISSHLISPSAFRVCPSVSSHAPGSLIKCRGSLVVRPPGPGIPDYFRIHQTSCCQKQNSHKYPDYAQASRILHRKQNFSEFPRLHVQNSPELQIFHPSEFPVSSHDSNIRYDQVILEF